jgi:uncharacterized membrane protein YphA (DoxX/SURF4 family)
MLSLFPQILFLAPAGTTLLRVAAALCFAYIAWDLIQRHYEISNTELPIIGHPQSWVIQLASFMVGAVAMLLLIGAWTQVAALAGAIIAFKHLVFYSRYRGILTFAKSTYFLLLCICIMLVVTGAGAFAFDFPL